MSTGFWVAMTMNGRGTGWGVPSTVTRRSSMTSSSADWVFGDARLISSASDDVGEDRTGVEGELAGPLVVDGHAGDVGGQQVGGELDPLPAGAIDAAAALASVVLPTPGTSSTSRCPSLSRQTRARPTCPACP